MINSIQRDATSDMKSFNASYYCVKQYGYIGVKAAKSGKIEVLDGDSFIDCFSCINLNFFSLSQNSSFKRKPCFFLGGT